MEAFRMSRRARAALDALAVTVFGGVVVAMTLFCLLVSS